MSVVGKTPLRFALLSKNHHVETWLARSMAAAQAAGVASCVAVVQPANELRMPNRAVRHRDVLVRPRNWGHFALRSLWLRTPLLESVPVDAVLPGLDRLEVTCEQQGSAVRLTEESVERMRAMELDFILLGDFGILKGDVLSCTRLGVWSFHHGDPRSYRGRPSCFWELHDRSSVVSAGLQRISETLDGGEFLRLVTVATKPSFSKTMTALYEASTTMLASACGEAVEVGRPSAAIELPEALPPIRKRPTNRAVFRATANVARAAGTRLVKGLFVRRDWEVGVAEKPPEAPPWCTDLAALDWLSPPSRMLFWADPFIAEVDGDCVTAAVEEFDYRQGYGRIVLLQIEDGRVLDRSVVLDDGHHHAFPQLMRVEGGWLATTDTCCEPGPIYEFATLGDEWRPLPESSMPVGLSDPVLLQETDGWIAVGTNRHHDSGSWCVAYSRPDHAAQWEPIQPYPLFVDATRARGGGTVDPQTGIRVAQDCSGSYGDGVTVTRFDIDFWRGRPQLAQNANNEVRSAEIAGTHTVSWLSGESAVMADRCIYRFDLLAWWYRLRERRRRRACVRGANRRGEFAQVVANARS